MVRVGLGQGPSFIHQFMLNGCVKLGVIFAELLYCGMYNFSSSRLYFFLVNRIACVSDTWNAL